MSSAVNDVEAHASLSSKDCVPVKALLATPGLDPIVAKRIQDADQDGSGGMSLAEIVKVFQAERAANAERNILRKVAIGTAVCFLLLCGAMAGLCYEMVNITKDMRVSNGVLLSKDTSAPVATGQVVSAVDISSLHKLPVSSISAMPVETLVVSEGTDGTYRVLSVADILVVPNKRATITTCTGRAFQVDDSGFRAATYAANTTASTTNPGRRLSQTTSVSPASLLQLSQPQLQALQQRLQEAIAKGDVVTAQALMNQLDAATNMIASLHAAFSRVIDRFTRL